jgi:hypothetical protein
LAFIAFLSPFISSFLFHSFSRASISPVSIDITRAQTVLQAQYTYPFLDPSIQADALIRLFDSSVANPVLAAVPFVQHEGTTTLNEWGVTARIARFVRPRAHSDEPFLLTLTGITRIRLTSTSTSTSDASPPLSHVTVVHPPPDAHSPPASDIVQEFKTAAIRLLERYAQDASQSVRKRESWARIAHVVDETGQSKAAALADAIVSVVGAEHPDKLGEGVFHLSCDLLGEAFFWAY